jgi:branched-chain amino acid transport system substrate-binding protein
MRRRTFLVLSGGAALAACTTAEYPPPPYPYAMPGVPPPVPYPQAAYGGHGPAAVLLVSLTGPRADIGQAMLQAAQLALSAQGGPPLVPADTGGSAEGAVSALRGSLGSGAGIVLGPLTAAETQAVAPVASGAGIPVLAFTNTASAARPGVWTLGITPAQQVDRVVQYARMQGRSRFAAFLPNTEFGHALAQAYSASLARAGLTPVAIQFHGPGMSAISAGLKSLSAYESRWGDIQQKIRKLRAQNTAEARREAERLTRTPASPPPFDALLLGDTGEGLAEIAPLLSYYFINGPQVRIMGPTLWAAPASGSRQIRGAIYAAPDESARQPFVQAFSARYSTPPPGPADLAYDAARIASLTAPAGYSPAALTNPAGFSGVDGWLRLLPDGQVQRALAVFQIQEGGPREVAPPAPPPAV